MSIGSSDLKMAQKVVGLHFITGADLDVNASDGSGGVRPSSQPGFTPDTPEEAKERAEADEAEAAALRAEAKAVARESAAAAAAPAEKPPVDDDGPSKEDLLALAKEHEIKGRSAMGKDDLAKALTEAGVEF